MKERKRIHTSQFATVPLTNFGADLAFTSTGVGTEGKLQVILVLVDFYNKHVKLFLLPNKEQETVFKAFHEYFSMFGLNNPAVGLTIYTDQGKEFSKPNSITYDYITMLHPRDYAKHEVDYKEGVINRRQRAAPTKGKEVPKSKEPITIHGHTFNYAVEAQVWSFKSRLKKVFDDLKMKTGKVKQVVTQDILDDIEDDMNESKEYFSESTNEFIEAVKMLKKGKEDVGD